MGSTIDKRLREYEDASRGRQPAIDKGAARDQGVLDAWSNTASANSRMWEESPRPRQSGFNSGSGSDSDPPSVPDTNRNPPGARPGHKMVDHDPWSEPKGRYNYGDHQATSPHNNSRSRVDGDCPAWDKARRT